MRGWPFDVTEEDVIAALLPAADGWRPERHLYDEPRSVP